MKSLKKQRRVQVIAVTGSVAKTTTRQMIHTILRTRLAGTQSPRNFNNHLGVPLSMTAIEPEHDYAVLELGAGEICLNSIDADGTKEGYELPSTRMVSEAVREATSPPWASSGAAARTGPGSQHNVTTSRRERDMINPPPVAGPLP